MAKRLIPLLDRVLIERIVAPTKSVGGILLPDSALSKINEALVVAVGPGRRMGVSGELIPMSVKPGDTVLLPDYGGQMVNLGSKGGEKSEKELFLYRDEEILGLVETKK
mmetsp:Transcript_18329/g.45599  ORF Transcript_18329/g.45599 Transcript_18329/m.45599 type:complete len:109 (+) Transcript_18329:92-418(+)|eukprot:CAMPEP_0197586502 /NCGR_PEP_ID=MMETSP1326-20131121/8452_1 /TAXON_ID=1155430 /ORGANISM="Genus nov. species nov., Strain RCC2288" /LENGTH=108 /DNA_ID=CAMNT_0043151137 /DNA_START=70 /DNA_END=396 /DNA_ORIENTATION=+